MYIGAKCGLDVGMDAARGTQFMSDVADFSTELGKAM
jgi:hypothetical protein